MHRGGHGGSAENLTLPDNDSESFVKTISSPGKRSSFQLLQEKVKKICEYARKKKKLQSMIPLLTRSLPTKESDLRESEVTFQCATQALAFGCVSDNRVLVQLGVEGFYYLISGGYTNFFISKLKGRGDGEENTDNDNCNSSSITEPPGKHTSVDHRIICDALDDFANSMELLSNNESFPIQELAVKNLQDSVLVGGWINLRGERLMKCIRILYNAALQSRSGQVRAMASQSVLIICRRLIEEIDSHPPGHDGPSHTHSHQEGMGQRAPEVAYSTGEYNLYAMIRALSRLARRKIGSCVGGDSPEVQSRQFSIELLTTILRYGKSANVTRVVKSAEFFIFDVINTNLCTTHPPSLFSNSIRLFEGLMVNLRHCLWNEIAVYMAKTILPLLNSPNSIYSQRISILQFLNQISMDYELILELFLNTDCNKYSFAVILSMVKSLCFFIHDPPYEREQLSTQKEYMLKHYAIQCIVLLSRSLIRCISKLNETQDTAERSAKPETQAWMNRLRDIRFRMLWNNRGEKAGHKFITTVAPEMSEDHAAMARFLRFTPGLSKLVIGKFFSANKDYNLKIFVHYCDTFHFAGVPIDIAVRTLFTSFRMLGESQVVQRLTQTLANKFVDDNKPFPFTEDETDCLCIGVLVLNTDQHNPNATPSFTRNNFPVIQSETMKRYDYDEELRLIFDRVQKDEIKIDADAEEDPHFEEIWPPPEPESARSQMDSARSGTPAEFMYSASGVTESETKSKFLVDSSKTRQMKFVQEADALVHQSVAYLRKYRSRFSTTWTSFKELEACVVERAIGEVAYLIWPYMSLCLHNTTDDPRFSAILPLCGEGYSYGQQLLQNYFMDVEEFSECLQELQKKLGARKKSSGGGKREYSEGWMKYVFLNGEAR